MKTNKTLITFLISIVGFTFAISSCSNASSSDGGPRKPSDLKNNGTLNINFDTKVATEFEIADRDDIHGLFFFPDGTYIVSIPSPTDSNNIIPVEGGTYTGKATENGELVLTKTFYCVEQEDGSFVKAVLDKNNMTDYLNMIVNGSRDNGITVTEEEINDTKQHLDYEKTQTLTIKGNDITETFLKYTALDGYTYEWNLKDDNPQCRIYQAGATTGSISFTSAKKDSENQAKYTATINNKLCEYYLLKGTKKTATPTAS